jgi:hypothetical protein
MREFEDLRRKYPDIKDDINSVEKCTLNTITFGSVVISILSIIIGYALSGVL